MFRINQLLFLLVAAMGLTACASNPGNQPTLEQKLEEGNYRLGEPVESIENYRLNGWNYLDGKHVIIRTIPATSYLVTLRYQCTDLVHAEDIGFTSTASRLTRYDTLLVKMSGGTVDRCLIDELHKLERVSG